MSIIKGAGNRRIGPKGVLMKTRTSMISRLFVLSCSMIVLLAPHAAAQTAGDVESDPLVLKKLDWFKDQKFGFMMHWGPYSQWGIVESWSLCPEDYPWCQRKGEYADDYFTYKKAYENLQKTFNPVRFNPESWATAAQEAGMRYLVFTTKHHDGFCMFDTKETSYKITDHATPFHTNPRSNAVKEIFSAFRAKGLGIGAYFSKPDWHSENYWWSYFPPKDRNVNYEIKKYPERWKAFQQFTYNQIEELMSGYGPVDILWLDGGWVSPDNKDQSVDMPRIASMARGHQPGLIMVDRAVPGRFENYRTPEQEVPDKPLDYPWETCMTMGNSWSYVPNDAYKPTHRLIHLLVDIVSKGGNFLLNVGPTPAGELPPAALDRMKEIGAWMKVNGSAIYSTRPRAPYAEHEIRYTQLADGSLNAVFLAEKEGDMLPVVVEIPSFCPAPGSKVVMLGTSTPLTWEARGKGCLIKIPDTLRKNPPCRYAWTFRFTAR
jgi:alpha-L-fucosidase